MKFGFDPEFAGVTDWARFYRDLGLQVVPAMRPHPTEQWKRPLVPWKEHEKALVDDATFEGWFGPAGKFRSVSNIGILTGSCSGNVGAIDLDDHKGGAPQAWLEMAASHSNDMIPPTLVQITGGGGRQMLFRWPKGVIIPTGKTKRGVDIRGEGGFTVLPPSRHLSGKDYGWLAGYGPQDGMEIADLPPEWVPLIDQLLADEREGRPATSGAPSAEIIPLHGSKTHTLAGEALDGREGYMTKLVWAAAAELRRQHAFPPSPAEIDTAIHEAYRRYEANVAPRNAPLGEPKHIGLEREGRGPSLFAAKFRYAVQQWDGKLREAAARPTTAKPTASEPVERRQVVTDKDGVTYDAETGEVVAPDDANEFETKPRVLQLYGLQDLLNAPDPRFLVTDMIIENGLGFLYGPPGCGKSFVALDLALSLASGLESWMGRQITQKGGVLYLAGEGRSGAKRRTMAWANGRGCHDLGVNFHMAFESLNFMQAADIETLERTIELLIERRGETPVLIVVDTVSRVLPGAKENDQADMTLFVQACDRVRQRFGCAVMGVHHSAKGSGQMRGSTVLLGAADFAFSLLRIDESGDDDGPPVEGAFEVTFLAEKIKDAPDHWTEKLEMTETPCGDIAASSSLVPQLKKPVFDDWEADKPNDLGFNRRAQREMLAVLREAEMEGRPLGPTLSLEGYGRGDVAKICQKLGLMRDETGPKVRTQLQRWAMAGIIRHYKYSKTDRAPDYPQHWSNGKQSGWAVIGDLDFVQTLSA